MTKEERIVKQGETLIRNFKVFAIDYNSARSGDGWQKDIETLNALLEAAKKQVGALPLSGEDVDGNGYKICRECCKIIGDDDDLKSQIWKPNYCPDCGRKIDWSECDF